MAPKQLWLHLLLLTTLLSFLAFSDVSSESKLLKILAKREASQEPKPMAVGVSAHDAAGFLVRRTKRKVWHRRRPDVQQWITQLMHMGYDEGRLETDLSYWMDYSRAHDQGRQHHYDENAPIGPRDSASFRHGANVNYDYY